MEGYVYHLTQRCHNRKFLLRFARDREAYRKWWIEAVNRFRLPIYGYCITRNHVHALVYASDRKAVSGFMHLASGSTAKSFNLRKGVEGSMWEHPYQCTIVETGTHLLNCLCYIDLNMVRAGVTEHPGAWRWCGYDELAGIRKRYRLLNIKHLIEMLSFNTPEEFHDYYRGMIEERLRDHKLAREACWTEALAVGSRDFAERVREQFPHRRSFSTEESSLSSGTAWMIRDGTTPYTTISEPETVSKP